MPVRLVQDYRLLYRKQFMCKTLHSLRHGRQRVEIEQIEGVKQDDWPFDNCSLVIDHSGPDSNRVWAGNSVTVREADGHRVGLILLHPSIADESDDVRKFVLAKEWVETMVLLRDGRRYSNKTVGARTDFLLQYADVCRRDPWQEMFEEWAFMHSGLRRLLVSRDSIVEILEDPFGLTVEQFRNLWVNRRDEATSIYEKVADLFERKWSVDSQLARTRLGEVLLDGGVQ